jgi:FkbM family methyltransferase
MFRCCKILKLTAFFAAAPLLFPARLEAAELRASYETRAEHDPNGIGKFYMGREIAQVMGHQGADWLERPERAEEEAPDKLVNLLELKPGENVADIGAGTGYMSWRIAKKIAPAGRVYAVDIQPEMLDQLRDKMRERKITNVEPVHGSISDPKLPAAAMDLAIMVDVYHEFSEPRQMMEGILRSLKPGGRVAFVEYRAEDPNVPIKRVHKMSEAQVKKEAAAVGLEWVKTIEELPRQHLIIFRKPLTQAPDGSAKR